LLMSTIRDRKKIGFGPSPIQYYRVYSPCTDNKPLTVSTEHCSFMSHFTAVLPSAYCSPCGPHYRGFPAATAIFPPSAWPCRPLIQCHWLAYDIFLFLLDTWFEAYSSVWNVTHDSLRHLELAARLLQTIT